MKRNDDLFVQNKKNTSHNCIFEIFYKICGEIVITISNIFKTCLLINRSNHWNKIARVPWSWVFVYDAENEFFVSTISASYNLISEDGYNLIRFFDFLSILQYWYFVYVLSQIVYINSNIASLANLTTVCSRYALMTGSCSRHSFVVKI